MASIETTSLRVNTRCLLTKTSVLLLHANGLNIGIKWACSGRSRGIAVSRNETGVRIEVLVEIRPQREALAALRAHEWLLWRVRLHVCAQIAPVCERLPAMRTPCTQEPPLFVFFIYLSASSEFLS